MNPIDQKTNRIEQQLKATKFAHLVIDGFTCTYHAMARMLARDIGIEWVQETLSEPGRGLANNPVRKHIGPWAMCVANHDTHEIITIGYGTLGPAASSDRHYRKALHLNNTGGLPNRIGTTKAHDSKRCTHSSRVTKVAR